MRDVRPIQSEKGVRRIAVSAFFCCPTGIRRLLHSVTRCCQVCQVLPLKAHHSDTTLPHSELPSGSGTGMKIVWWRRKRNHATAFFLLRASPSYKAMEQHCQVSVYGTGMEMRACGEESLSANVLKCYKYKQPKTRETNQDITCGVMCKMRPCYGEKIRKNQNFTGRKRSHKDMLITTS